MSAQAVNMLLGTGKLYAKRSTDTDGKWRLIGSIKGEASFNYKPGFVEQRPSDVIAAVRRDKIEESAMLKCTLVDFRLDQIIPALGLSISSTQLTLTSSIRLAQELTTGASTTTSKCISQTAKSTTSIAFTSLDRATDYVRGTDFTLISKKKFKPISAAFKSKAVRAYYTKKFTAATRIDIGDNALLQSVSLMYVHQKSNGKHVSIQFPLATIHSDLTLAFKEKDYTMPEVTFAALADPTAAKGKKLFSIVVEP
jgi:hypothetical protein